MTETMIVWDKDGITARRVGLFQSQLINGLMHNAHHIGYYTYTDKKTMRLYVVFDYQ